MTGNDLGGMGDLADAAAQATDAELSDQEAALLKNTGVDLASLRPQLACSDADFAALVSAVEAATANNESLAQLKQRLQALGSGVVALAGKAAKAAALL